ncbi:MAG: hypothetical protein ACREPM_00560, partial [Gemmatimonadaceae bacterium]
AGIVWRIGHASAVEWKARASWTPVLVDEDIIVGTGRDSLVVASANTGLVMRSTPLESRVPFALGGGSVWLRGREPRLFAVAVDGSSERIVPLAAPAPHPLVGDDGRAVVLAGALSIQRVDMTSGTVEHTMSLDAPEAWPLLVATDGRVVYRDAELGLRVIDTTGDAPPVTLATGHMVLGAHVHAGCLFVLEQDLDNRRQAAIRCFTAA